MQFATSNLEYCDTEEARRHVDFLNSHNWEIVALQEVSRDAWDVITDSGIAESGLYTLDGLGMTLLGERPHGAAPLARTGYLPLMPKLMLGFPKVERPLVARMTVVPRSFTRGPAVLT